MVFGEREMIRKLIEDDARSKAEAERFTSLQPTYEDSVPPDDDEAWEHEAS
jgi:hypothetical protein